MLTILVRIRTKGERPVAPIYIVLFALVIIAPAIVYQVGTFMKEMRQQRMEEMKQRAEMDSKILGLDTSSTEIKVELAEIRKELADLRRMVTGGPARPTIEPTETGHTAPPERNTQTG